jgi:hypothetical protein
MAICHEVAVGALAPGRGSAWLAIQLAIGAAVIVPGLWIAQSTRRVRDGREIPSSAIGATATLGLVSIGQLAVWGALFPAIFALLAIVDGSVLAWVPRRRWVASVLLTMVFLAAGAALVLVASSVIVEP